MLLKAVMPGYAHYCSRWDFAAKHHASYDMGTCMTAHDHAVANIVHTMS